MASLNKKPGIKGEPHSITNISNHYIQKFADRLIAKPYGCQFLDGNTQNNGYVNWWYRYEDTDGESRIRYISAHRFSALTSGKFTEDQVNDYCVLHHCDQHYANDDVSYRQCVNPDHLWIGTTAENNADCVAKGRASTPVRLYGTDNFNSKLTEDQVKYIIKNHYIITQKKLAIQHGVNTSTIESIHRNKTWQYLARK
tara:strand:- start:325 stop:918 length:594 start_codon:yes stop_codon:yes gene_type:complete